MLVNFYSSSTYEQFNYEVNSNIKFVRNRNYNSSQAVNRLPTPSPVGFWCWAVQESELSDFYDVAYDIPWQLVRPYPKEKIYAVRYSEADAYICGYSKTLPNWEDFDPSKHLTIVRDVEKDDIMGNYLGISPDIINAYAIFCCGRIKHRRNKQMIRIGRHEYLNRKNHWSVQ